jgi:YbbR domain-containing protein
VRIAPRYPWTLLLAFLLACLTWYGTAFQRRERISEKQVEASLTLVNVPSDMVITSDVPRSLSLRIRGPLSRLRTLDPSQVGVVLDLTDAREGDHEFPVEPQDVVVPEGVEVVAVSPPQVFLRLERVVQLRLPIRPRVTGQPAEGMEVGEITVLPSSAAVTGPRLQLDSVQALVTDPVTVDGAGGAVEANVAVRSPSPLIRVVQPSTVRVTVQIVPIPQEKPEKGGGKRH